jgi:hypothetical protein
MFSELASWVNILRNFLPPPVDSTQLEDWLDSAEILAEDLLDKETDQRIAAHILTIYSEKQCSAPAYVPITSDQLISMLCSRPQTEQRTAAWYNEMVNTLSASELEDIRSSPRIRGQLVMSKVGPPQQRSIQLAVHSHAMTAFDWGIRFEPVVKQIYCAEYSAKIHELGRLRSEIDSRMSASPDGLVVSGPRKGRLIEIKCPVTREPDGKISRKYYTQMQSQMFITGLDICDFVEAVFISPYSSEQSREGPSRYYGEILLIEKECHEVQELENTEKHCAAIYRYEYSELNPTQPFEVELREDETIIERIPWRLYSWTEQVVYALENWWGTICPEVDNFWADVERARRGEFIVPEGRGRKHASVKDEICLIKVNKLNTE